MWTYRVRLVDWKLDWVTIHCSWRREDEVVHITLLHDVEQVNGACDVVVVVQQRDGRRLSNSLQPGKMDDCRELVLLVRIQNGRKVRKPYQSKLYWPVCWRGPSKGWSKQPLSRETKEKRRSKIRGNDVVTCLGEIAKHTSDSIKARQSFASTEQLRHIRY